MNVLIADAALGAAVIPMGGTPKPLHCGTECPYMPACAQNRLFVCCRKKQSCFAVERSTLQPLFDLPCPPALAALCVSPCGRWLYQLSTEADAIHTLQLARGELHYAAPAGVFPRSMRLHPTGRWLLTAGGAINEVYLFNAPTLDMARTVHTKSPCFAAEFWKNGLVLVCAEEGDDIQTVIYTVNDQRPRPREVQRLPGQPGGLCVCPDGLSALLSTPDGLMKLDIATGKLLWNLPEWALSMKLCCEGGWALVSETLTGQICLLNHEQPWLSRIVAQGADGQACFC